MFKSYIKDNHQVIINTDDGSTYMTARSYSQLVSVSRATVLSRLKNSTIAEVVTDTGMKTYRLVPETVFLEWLKLDSPDVYQSMIKGHGIRAYLYELVGYESGGVAPF